MRIAQISLKNFKRFTNLQISNIPATAKLVVVVGPNGCGKSSLFDALNTWHNRLAGVGWNTDELYYRKDASTDFAWNDSITVGLHGIEVPRRGCVYVRSAFRNDPDFAAGPISRPPVPTDEQQLMTLGQTDSVVAGNFRRLVYNTAQGVFDNANDAKTVKAFREELIGTVQTSMAKVFDDLVLNALSDPLGHGAFTFKKGTISSYHYKNLSGGERVAFDLLLDLHIKKRFYRDAIYCIDEVETHLHTKVQGRLLKELVQIVPDEGQLWVTTHSLGVLRAAQELAAASPGKVAILDFDGVSPDEPLELSPTNLDRVSWTKLLSITIDDLVRDIAPTRVFVCEGSDVGRRRRNFDAEVYDRVIASRNPGILFVSGGSSNELGSSGLTARQALERIIPTARVVALADRDSKSPEEVAEFEANGNLVLPVRNIESFLFADDVLEALLAAHNKSSVMDDVRAIKVAALEKIVQEQGKPPDDLKSAAGLIYVELKRLLVLNRGGNTVEAFMRDTLAPLIKPGMQTYDNMVRATLGRATA